MGDARWDVVVVGAGPAGSAAALSALRVAPGARVLLLDRSTFPRDKACGDGIAPHALDVLTDLGLPGLVDDHRPVSRLRLEVAGGGRTSGTTARPARVVPRVVLDDRIRAGALAAGAVPGRRRVRTVRVEADGVVLDADHDPLHARVVVAADGAGSVLRRALGLAPNGPGHVALALRGYATVRPDLADEQRIVFADDDRPAYAWSFPVGDGRANVGYGELLRGDRTPTREHLLSRLEDLLPGSARDGDAWRGHHLPLSSHRPRQPDGRVLLVGDALSLINPMTGEGIYYAVLSGACAGAAAVWSERGGPGRGVAARGGPGRGGAERGGAQPDGPERGGAQRGGPEQGGAQPDGPGLGGWSDPGRTYRRMLAQRLGRHLRHTTVAAALATRLPVVPAGVAAAAADPGVFDDLVELGLGRGLLTPRTLRGTVSALVRPGRTVD